jgi:integrase/recombinase XerD
MQQITAPDDSPAAGWERTLYAFLAEKERRFGSQRTVQSYSRMLRDFFGRSGKTPNEVTSQDVFTWAYGTGLSGKRPGSVTIGARLACVSSFYRFLIRMELVASNPCDALDRPRIIPGIARGLSADQIRRLLDAIPAKTPVGLRDRAIVLTLILTGRRREEILRLKVEDISQDGSVFYELSNSGGSTRRILSE